MLKIVPVEDILLGKPCDIGSQKALDDLARLGLDLMTLAIENDNALGLSAVQCGVPLNAFVCRYLSPYPIEDQLFGVDCPANMYSLYVNCSYGHFEDDKKVDSIEGCLSLGTKLYKVKRWPTIKLVGKLIGPDIETGEIVDIHADMVVDNPYQAVIFQHEIDHSFGILISDIGQIYETK